MHAKMTKKEKDRAKVKALVEKLLTDQYDLFDFSFELPALLLDCTGPDVFGEEQGAVFDACGMYDEDAHKHPDDPNYDGMLDNTEFKAYFQQLYDKYLKD